MLTLTDLHLRKLQELRESRDIVAIAKRAEDDAMEKERELFRTRFEEVFGFKPELGEAVEDHNMHSLSYWVQGFEFTIGLGRGFLFVRKRTGSWAKLLTPRDFYDLHKRGEVVAND